MVKNITFFQQKKQHKQKLKSITIKIKIIINIFHIIKIIRIAIALAINGSLIQTIHITTIKVIVANNPRIFIRAKRALIRIRIVPMLAITARLCRD